MEVSMQREEMNRRPLQVVTLCGVQGCCPTLEVQEDGGVIIRDDFGGNVRLNHQEWNDLKEKIFRKEIN